MLCNIVATFSITQSHCIQLPILDLITARNVLYVMVTRLPVLLLLLTSCLVGLGSSWSNEVVCFEDGSQDLQPVQVLDCYDLAWRLFTLPYLRTELLWSSRARGPSRLPFFLKSGTCQLWFVANPAFAASFDDFAMINVVRNVTSIIRTCLGSPHTRMGGPWGGHMDIGDFSRIRMSLVNHQHPPRSPEQWPSRYMDFRNLTYGNGHAEEQRMLQASKLRNLR